MGTDNTDILSVIQEQLQTVYDPDFPIIDIWTLGLIYDIVIDEDEKVIHITLTLTTPACPHGETLQTMMTNALAVALPQYTLEIEITFDPMWSIQMIKDEDLKRMFD